MQGLARYVCNYMHIHSSCTGVCELDIENGRTVYTQQLLQRALLPVETMVEIKHIKTKSYEWKQSPN